MYRLSTISQYQGHHRRISSTFKEGSLNRKAIKSIGDLNKQTLVPLENIDSQKGIDEFRLQREKLEKMSRMKSRVRLNHMARHEGLATQ